MPAKILFVISEVGSANYCLPLWNRWSKASNEFDWKILTNERVIKTTKLNKFSKKLIKNYNPKESFEFNINKLNWSPEIIFSSAANKNIEFESMLYSSKKKIKGIQFFDTWYSYHGRIAKKKKNMLATKICVIDQDSLLEAIQEGVKKEKIHIIGQPALENIKPIPKNAANNIMFVNQPISKYPHLKFLNYNEKDVWNILFDSIKKIRDNYKFFYFAKHPDDENVILDQKIVDELKIKVIENGQQKLKSSNTILGMFSTIMVDAFFQRKNVVGIQPSKRKRNCCFLSRKKYIPLVSNSQELINVLTNDNKNSDFLKVQQTLSGSLNKLNSFFIQEKNN